jgi:hypothetical protein
VVATDSSLIARELAKEFRARADSVKASAAPELTMGSAAAGTSIKPDSAAPKGPARPSLGAFVVALAVLLGLAYAAPIMIGVSSPLHLLIAGFALYEAWKLNRGVALRVTGPYQVVQRAAPA